MKYFINNERTKVLGVDTETGTITVFNLLLRSLIDPGDEEQLEVKPVKEVSFIPAKKKKVRGGGDLPKKEKKPAKDKEPRALSPQASEIIEQARSGKKAGEIAEDLGVSIATVYTTIYKARKDGTLGVKIKKSEFIETKTTLEQRRNGLIPTFGRTVIFKIEECMNNGYSAEDIVVLPGIDLSTETVQKIINELQTTTTA